MGVVGRRSAGVQTRALAALGSRPSPDSLDALLAEVHTRGGPVVEVTSGDLAEITFVAAHEYSSISVWLPVLGRAFPSRMRRLGTDSTGRIVWALGIRVPTDSVLSYVFIADNPVARLGPVAAARLFTSAQARTELIGKVIGAAFPDPANAARVPGPYGNEVLREAARPTTVRQWVSVLDIGDTESTWDYRPVTGQIEGFAVSRHGIERVISVYRPAESRGELPLCLLLDGETFSWYIPDLERAMSEGRIPRAVCAFVHNATETDRVDDLACNPDFRDLIVEDVLPEIRRRYPVAAEGGATTVVGSSIGGLAAAYLALEHPEQFGSVVALSGSFWWGPRGRSARRRGQDVGLELLRRRISARSDPWPVRFWASHGDLEADAGRGRSSFLSSLRRFAATAQPLVTECTVRQYRGGHDLPGWREPLLEGIGAVLGPRS